MKIQFKNPKFIKTAVKAKDYPDLRDEGGALLPEVAVVGRSNVGKSSLLNNLFNVRGLVRTSSTPGKTQHLNFFTVAGTVSFVDLPGYGYAKVAKEVLADWPIMIETYLEKRATLKVILFLFDIRRDPKAEDIELIDWLIFQQKKVILVLTKGDKVSRNQRAAAVHRLLKAFQKPHLPYVVYSTTQKFGREDLIRRIEENIL